MRRFVTLAVVAMLVHPPVGGYQGIDLFATPAFPVAPSTEPDLSAVPQEYREIILDAARAANVPVRILAGIAFAESSFRPDPPHPDPWDKGMFGLHERYHEERAALYGEYDPLDPAQAARVAAGILADHRSRFGTWDHAIAAYRQGAWGVMRDGIGYWYVERVRGI